MWRATHIKSLKDISYLYHKNVQRNDLTWECLYFALFRFFGLDFISSFIFHWKRCPCTSSCKNQLMYLPIRMKSIDILTYKDECVPRTTPSGKVMHLLNIGWIFACMGIYYCPIDLSLSYLKCTVIQIEKALINDRLYVLKVSWKFRIPTIHNFAAIYPWNWLSS